MLNTITQYDPTRTLLLRNAFGRALTSRFRNCKSLVHQAIVKNDAFGLKARFPVITDVSAPGHRAFDFPQTADKVAAFMTWFDQQIVTRINNNLFDTFIDTFYQRGIMRGRQLLRSAGYRAPTIDETGGVRVAVNQPAHSERLGLVKSRVSNELDGILASLRQLISRNLTQSMLNETTPAEVFKLLEPVFKSITYRTEVMARTEAIRAHHLATVQEYRNWGVTSVNVRTEQSQSSKCGCETLQNKDFNLNEIEGIIPYHVSCRCCAVPSRKIA